MSPSDNDKIICSQDQFIDWSLLNDTIMGGNSRASCRVTSEGLFLEGEVVEDYGVWGLKKFMGKEYMGINRTTFIIDEKGIIEDIIQKVNTKEHTSQIIN